MSVTGWAFHSTIFSQFLPCVVSCCLTWFNNRNRLMVFFFFFKYNYGSTQTYTKLKIYNHQTPKSGMKRKLM